MVVGTALEKGIHAINEASNHLIHFVDSYRKLTQLQQPVVTDLPLRDFVSDIKALYPDVEWRVDIPAEVSVRADATLLHQVFVNLTRNAVEAGAKTLSVDWDDATLRMSNDGLPIPAEVQRDIFIPFYTTKPTGTGVGLALSRQIMTLLGGALSLADKAKGGYHVTFVLGFERR